LFSWSDLDIGQVLDKYIFHAAHIGMLM
jgi:hypothetical protein